MTMAKIYLKKIKTELQELFGTISVREIVSNQQLTRNYEIVHQQMMRWV